MTRSTPGTLPGTAPLEAIMSSGARLVREVIAAARPAQWTKNLLVCAAFVFSAGAAWSWHDSER